MLELFVNGGFEAGSIPAASILLRQGYAEFILRGLAEAECPA